MNIIEKALDQGRNMLSEHESKLFLKSKGVPVTRSIEIRSQNELLKTTLEIGYPLVMKACSPDLSHKTEKGLIHLDIRNDEEAVACWQQLSNQIEGRNAAILVQEMIKGQRELVVGLTRDPQFGPCVMFGLGGIFTEILRDITFRIAPLEKKDALEMMTEIRAYKILEAVRGMPAVDLDSLAQILIAVGNIGMEDERVKEIDINPIILLGEKPIAADALVVLDRKQPARLK